MSEEPTRHGFVPVFRELIIIVAGVLIALGVDNWNDGRRDRALEAQYLNALEADLRSDSAAYETIFFPALERKDSALQIIAPVVRGGALGPDTLGFLDAVGLGGLLGTKNPLILARRATYDELLATGNLSLLRSRDLRAALVTYYMDVDIAGARIEARLADYPIYVHQYYPAELRNKKTATDVRTWGVKRSVQAFTSPAFQALMDQEINAMYFSRSQFAILSEATTELLRRVEAAEGDGK